MSHHENQNLDDELDIPPIATLSIHPPLSAPIRLVFQLPSSQDGGDVVGGSVADVVTIAVPADNNNGSNVASTLVSVESSMRASATPRCIVVGRQASASDVRIDHKSVSRRHTALYYSYKNSSETAKGSTAVLIVKDLGGKHGTYLDNRRLEKNGTLEISLDNKNSNNTQHVIRFGNAPVVCHVKIPAAQKPSMPKSDNNNSIPEKSAKETTDVMQQSENENEAVNVPNGSTDQGNNNNATKSKNDEENKMETDVASSRETREAQIAAMIASFDAAPTYKPYVPPEEGNDGGSTASNVNGSNHKSNNGAKHNDIHTNSNTDNMNTYNLPITSSITLSPGSDSFTSSDGTNTPLQSNSAVATLCFEPSGSRLVAGHRDGTIRFYDFHGMKPSTITSSEQQKVTYPPFRIVDSDNDPLDQTGRHILTAISPSPTGSQWIVGTTSSQPKVLDREGRTTLYHFCKGDTYVTDASNTKGHTAGVTGVAFHPLLKDICWTCGLDGSIRQWDISGKSKMQFGRLVCQKVIAKCKNEKGQRTQITSCLGVHPSGRKIVVGTACGSIQIWNCFGGMVSSRPLGAVYSAHGASSKSVTYVTFSANGEQIASRSDSDDTVRVWDVSKMEKGMGSSKFGGGSRGAEGGHPPSILLAVCRGLPALNEAATCAFSPDGKMICAGTAVDRGATNDFGKLKFYQLPEEEKRSKASKDSASKSLSKKSKATAMLDPVETLAVAKGASILGVSWHPKLNQIAFGTSNGAIHVLYDPDLSTKGALIPASRTIRQSDGLSDLLRSRAPTGSAAFLTSSSANANIIAPNSLPLFRDEPRATRKTKERDRKDPEKTKLPQPPVTGGIKTGSGAGGGVNFTQFIVGTDSRYTQQRNIAGKDPREELFKYSEGKSYVSAAYEGDVQRVLAEKTVEEEEEEMKSRKKPKTK